MRKIDLRLLFIIFVLAVCFTSCKKAEEVKPITVRVEEPIVPIVEEPIVPIVEKEIEERIWSSTEFKLPIGNVVNMDFSHGNNLKKYDFGNNYVTIKRYDNTLTIVRDIDEDLYLNIQIGDKIR